MNDAGDYNRQFLLQKKVSGQDSEGQPVTGWIDIDDDPLVWVAVRGVTGMGAIRQQMEGSVSINAYSLRIRRYRTDLNSGIRAVEVDGGAIFDVKQVRLDKAGRVWTDLVCETGGNDG